MKIILILILTSLPYIKGYSQTLEDSIVNALWQKTSKLPNDTHKVNKLNTLSHKLTVNRSFDEALKCAKQALSLSKKLNYKTGIAESQNNIGETYYYKDDYIKAKEYYLKALEVDINIDNKIGISERYNNLGLCLSNLGNYSESLDYYLKSLKINEKRLSSI